MYGSVGGDRASNETYFEDAAGLVWLASHADSGGVVWRRAEVERDSVGNVVRFEGCDCVCAFDEVGAVHQMLEPAWELGETNLMKEHQDA